MTYSDLFNLRSRYVKFNDVADAIDGVIQRQDAGVATGTSTNYLVSPSPMWTSIATGSYLAFVPHVTSEYNPQLTLVNTIISTCSIKKNNIALPDGALVAGLPYMLMFVYDAVNGNRWEVMNDLFSTNNWLTYSFTTAIQGNSIGFTPTESKYKYSSDLSEITFECFGSFTGTGTPVLGYELLMPLPVNYAGDVGGVMGVGHYRRSTGARLTMTAIKTTLAGVQNQVAFYSTSYTDFVPKGYFTVAADDQIGFRITYRI